MTINSHSLRDMLTNLLDTAASEEKPVDRFQLLEGLMKEAHDRLIRDRNRAMYEARLGFTVAELGRMLNCDRQKIDRLVRDHIADTGAPPIPKRSKRDLRNARRLSI